MFLYRNCSVGLISNLLSVIYKRFAASRTELVRIFDFCTAAFAELCFSFYGSTLDTFQGFDVEHGIGNLLATVMTGVKMLFAFVFPSKL